MNTSNEAAILEASYKSDLATVQRLIRESPALANLRGQPDRWENGTPLTLAAVAGHLPIVQLLLDRGADVNVMCNDGSGLLMAVWGGNEQVVRLFLDRGAKVNEPSASGETPLMAAAFKGFVAIGRLLIERGGDVNAQTTAGPSNFFSNTPPVVGESALHLAAAYGHGDFVKILLAAGANREAKDCARQTPLHWATRHKQKEIFPLLLDPR